MNEIEDEDKDEVIRALRAQASGFNAEMDELKQRVEKNIMEQDVLFKSFTKDNDALVAENKKYLSVNANLSSSFAALKQTTKVLAEWVNEELSDAPCMFCRNQVDKGHANWCRIGNLLREDTIHRAVHGIEAEELRRGIEEVIEHKIHPIAKLKELLEKTAATDSVSFAESRLGFTRGSCPCELTEIEPCDPRCSCAKPNSKHGCRRCCRHGSREHRLGAARNLVERDKINIQMADLIRKALEADGVRVKKADMIHLLATADKEFKVVTIENS